jgi:hypothetical protein
LEKDFFDEGLGGAGFVVLRLERLVDEIDKMLSNIMRVVQ